MTGATLGLFSYLGHKSIVRYTKLSPDRPALMMADRGPRKPPPAPGRIGR